jgi:DHA1 family multidrug resistance protein-like MFS transporter
MWVQLSISLPLAAQTVGGDPSTVGLIYAINAGLTIALLYPLLKLASKWLRPMPVLIVGMALMAVGLGAIALMRDVPGLLACVVVFAIGTLLATPSQQTVTADLANPTALGSYFGISSLALAFGGGIGNLSGGLLYDIGKQIAFPQLPWLVFLVVGLASTAGLTLMLSNQRKASPQPAPHPATFSDAAK